MSANGGILRLLASIAASLENVQSLAGLTGPDGLMGPQGIPGLQGNTITGPAGTNGAAGAPGSVWRSGAAAPSNGLGVDGDYYLNTATGDVYRRTGGVYVLFANLRGPQGLAGTNGTNGIQGVPGTPGTNGTNGAPGAPGTPGSNGTNGAPGSVWRSGSGAPSNGLGVDGDFYLDTASGRAYARASGVYSQVASLAGPQGVQGVQGVPGASGTNGTNGTQGIQGIQGVPGPQGPPAWTNAVLGSDFTTSGTALVDVPGLAFAPAAGKVYEFRALLLVRTATAATTPRPAIAWPTATDGVAMLRIANTVATDNIQEGNIGGVVEIPVGALPNTTQSWPAEAEGVLVSGPTPSGTLKVQLASETAAVVVTIKAGSFLSWREVS